uniref:Uncharacterized protein n=1 Tax=Pectinophora gossypiella TaxID=13191 RepID=A0A1E1WS97_PECGO
MMTIKYLNKLRNKYKDDCLSCESSALIQHTIFTGDRQVKNVALGSEHTICLATDNTLWAWGWNEHANTGTDGGDCVSFPTRVPLDIDTNTVITNIYAGGASNFIITNKDQTKDEPIVTTVNNILEQS